MQTIGQPLHCTVKNTRSGLRHVGSK